MQRKTYTEIFDQYNALKKTLDYCDKNYDRIRSFFQDARAENIVVIGCGSSYSLSRAVANNAQLFLNIPSMAIAGGDLMIHPNTYDAVFSQNTLLITLSRSGSTHEILFSAKKIREQYPLVKTLSFVCREDSSIGAVSDEVLVLPWAFDESVCQTRSVTNLFAGALYILAKLAGKSSVVQELSLLASEGDAFLHRIEEPIGRLAGTGWTNAMVLCDGESFGVAEEAALAFNEIAYTQSSCKHVLDVRHGPIVLIDEKTLVVAKLTKDGFDYQRALIEDLIRRRAAVVVIADEELPEIGGVAAELSFGHSLCDSVGAMLVLPVSQLLSYYKAVALGLNPDSPEGLDAWIALK